MLPSLILKKLQLIKKMNDMNIGKYSGEVYVFDFDDTLFFADVWHETVSFDKDGYVHDYGNSSSVYEALKLCKDNNGLRLQRHIIDMPSIGKYDVVVFKFVKNDNEILSAIDAKKYFSDIDIENANIDIRGKYSDDAIISRDDRYYENPKTIGTKPNNRVIDVYKNVDNPIILSARVDVKGIASTMIDRLVDATGKAPKKIFLKKTNDYHASAKYKGDIIVAIAKQDSVNKVVFYDDNAGYLTGVKNALLAYDSDNNKNISSKVELHNVDDEAKIAFMMANHIIKASIELATYSKSNDLIWQLKAIAQRLLGE